MATMNLDKINAIKRDMVSQVCEIAAQSGVVKEIVVFGSSVRDDCTPESDVDLCLNVSEAIQRRQMFNLHVQICKACDHNVDILNYAHLPEDLKNEINKEGVIVYGGSNKQKE